MIPVLRPPVRAAPKRVCDDHGYNRGNVLLLVGVSAPERGRKANGSGVEERVAKAYVLLSEESWPSGATPEEREQQTLWQQWRAYRPSQTARGQGGWRTFAVQEVFPFEPPVTFSAHDIGGHHLLGLKKISEHVWHLLEENMREMLLDEQRFGHVGRYGRAWFLPLALVNRVARWRCDGDGDGDVVIVCPEGRHMALAIGRCRGKVTKEACSNNNKVNNNNDKN